MKTRLANIAMVSFSIFFLAVSCEHFNRNKISDSNIAEGKILATQYCQSCHMLPDPKWVDAKTWEMGVMPAMGPKLGIFNFKGIHYKYNLYDYSLPP